MQSGVPAGQDVSRHAHAQLNIMGLTIGPRPECFTFLCTSHIHARCTGYKGRIQIEYHNMTIYDTKDGNKVHI